MSKPYNPKDYYFHKAKKEGLRARSAFKIEEIADRFQLLKPGLAVLDLGAAPGGWLQVMAARMGGQGTVIGVDLVPIAPIPRVRTAVLDIRAPEFDQELAKLHPGRFDLVTSDMAPKTTGIKQSDDTRQHELVELAMSVALRTLGKSGTFVAKVFMGIGFDELIRNAKRSFQKVKVIRPEATRERSIEVYMVATGIRTPPPAPAR